MPKFIACSQWEDTISHYGEGETQIEAFKDFVDTSEFSEHCIRHDVIDGDKVEVGIFKAINKDDPDWDSEYFESAWSWALGDRVDTKSVQFFMLDTTQVEGYEYVGKMELQDLCNMKLAGEEMYYQGCNDSVNKDGFGVVYNLEQVEQCRKIKNIWIKKITPEINCKRNDNQT